MAGLQLKCLPPKRDLFGEWAKAARAAGIRYGAAFHHEYTWWWWQSVTLLGYKGVLTWKQEPGSLMITCPDTTAFKTVLDFKIELR